MPGQLDSLIAGTPTTPTAEAPDTHAVDVSAPEMLDIVSASLAAKLEVVELDPEPLLDAGIGEIRYVDAKGNAEGDGPHTLDIFACGYGGSFARAPARGDCASLHVSRHTVSRHPLVGAHCPYPPMATDH